MIPTKKSLGQHWLYDDASLEAMCAAADIGPDDIVLEIGPGLGTLTAKLVKRSKQIIAVEYDPVLAKNLPQNVQDHIYPVSKETPRKRENHVVIKNLRVVQQDILRFDLSTLPPDYKIVANIPYYLTSNLLRILCESPNYFSQAALLVQKEVAQRVCAIPDDMSLLSVSVQFYCEATLGQVIPARLFTPQPKVDSQILKLVHRSRSPFADVHTRRFFQVVKAGFSQRRKTLLNSLSVGLHLSREDTSALLEKAQITPSTRAQNLSLADWHELYQALSSWPRTPN